VGAFPLKAPSGFQRVRKARLHANAQRHPVVNQTQFNTSYNALSWAIGGPWDDALTSVTQCFMSAKFIFHN